MQFWLNTPEILVNRSKYLTVYVSLLTMVLVITGTIVFFYVPYKTIRLEESNTTFTNPSRGFYVQFNSNNLNGLDELNAKGVSLVFLAYDLNEFIASDIAQEKLDELSDAFSTIKAHGLKVIFRVAYGFKDATEFSDPKSIEVIKAHIVQLSPILNEYQDVLLTVQAGFLGPWGEWHHSNLGMDDGKPTTTVINNLLEALSNAVPLPVSIAVRRPSFMRMINPDLVDLSRIAFHNDALLSTETDMGTYDLDKLQREEELEYINDREYAVANGGEMPNLSIYTEPSIALNELSKLKLTYLNLNYNKSVLDFWSSTRYEGKSFLDLIQQKLGYRLFIQTLVLPTHFKSTQKVEIKLTLMNSGFSAMALPYRAELIVGHNTEIYQVVQFENINLQDVEPGKTSTMKIVLDIKDLSKKISLGLRILETNMIEINDERTLVRLANDKISFIGGINYFAEYEWNGKNTYNLIQ